ncbi:MAG: hypothetical protein ABIB04_00390 [Patescibacteria group bacterium]
MTRRRVPTGQQGQSRDVDLATSNDIGLRFASNLVQIAGDRIGSRIDGDVAHRIRAAVEEAVGPAGANVLVAGAAAWLQVPQFLKTALVRQGVPPEVVALMDEGLDSVIHGITRAHQNGRLTGRDMDAAFVSTTSRVPDLEREITFQDAIASLSSDKQIVFQQKYALLIQQGEEVKVRFAAYGGVRKQRQALMNVVHALIALDPIAWLPHLELTLGAAKASTTATAAGGIKSLLGKLTDAVVGAAKSINDPITSEEKARLDERRDQAQTESDNIKARRRNRTW